MKENIQIHIGTSGWNYKHWKGHFYPEGLSPSKWLEFYVKHLRTVEINTSFYNLLQKNTFEKWYHNVPVDFIFSIKASRFITHMKKLKESESALKRFLEPIVGLKEKLGIILFQLPPYWHVNLQRLNDFLSQLPNRYRFAFEFRDDSWWQEETYQLLKKYNAAFCIFDLAGTQSPEEVTADFIYIRLHGPGDAYQGDYDIQTLAEWAETFNVWRKKVREIYCYFDNDERAFAVKNAVELQKMLI
jgi:uncharacterized protein YecE (DUF72 family)